MEAKERLGEKEVESLVWEFEVDREDGDDGRWSRDVTSIVEVGGKLWAVNWDEGLTEMQENEYPPQVAPQVEKRTRTVIETYYADVTQL